MGHVAEAVSGCACAPRTSPLLWLAQETGVIFASTLAFIHYLLYAIYHQVLSISFLHLPPTHLLLSITQVTPVVQSTTISPLDLCHCSYPDFRVLSSSLTLQPKWSLQKVQLIRPNFSMFPYCLLFKTAQSFTGFPASLPMFVSYLSSLSLP